MQRGRIEISPIRPDKSAYLRIHCDSGKEFRISKGSIKFAFENRLEANDLCTAVIESDSQAITTESLN